MAPSVYIRRSLPVFAAANLVGLLINAKIMHLTFNLLDIPELLCLGLATTASLGWNFFSSKLLVFHKG